MVSKYVCIWSLIDEVLGGFSGLCFVWTGLRGNTRAAHKCIVQCMTGRWVWIWNATTLCLKFRFKVKFSFKCLQTVFEKINPEVKWFAYTNIFTAKAPSCESFLNDNASNTSINKLFPSGRKINMLWTADLVSDVTKILNWTKLCTFLDNVFFFGPEFFKLFLNCNPDF